MFCFCSTDDNLPKEHNQRQPPYSVNETTNLHQHSSSQANIADKV